MFSEMYSTKKIWIEVLFIFAMKKSYIKSFSTFPRAELDTSSGNLLKNVSNFSFEFFCNVINWKRSNVVFLGRVNVNPNSAFLWNIYQSVCGGYVDGTFGLHLFEGTDIEYF